MCYFTLWSNHLKLFHSTLAQPGTKFQNVFLKSTKSNLAFLKSYCYIKISINITITRKKPFEKLNYRIEIFKLNVYYNNTKFETLNLHNE